jgi:8-oxo-dGTP diphosphatase
MDSQQVRVGVGVIVIKNNKVLMGKRINSHGHNTWNFPGGHLELGETPEQCAIRETLEEVGIKITKVADGPWTNDIFEGSPTKQYITIYMLAEYESGTPQVMEPKKCLEWQWFSWDNLPTPLFLPIQNLVESGFKPSLL